MERGSTYRFDYQNTYIGSHSIGFIGRLKLEIPYSSPKSQPWIICIDKLYIVAGPPLSVNHVGLFYEAFFNIMDVIKLYDFCFTSCSQQKKIMIVKLLVVGIGLLNYTPLMSSSICIFEDGFSFYKSRIFGLKMLGFVR